jgi:hypothetical protein
MPITVNVQERALLFLLTHHAKTEPLTAEAESLIAELREDAGLPSAVPVDQAVSPETKTAERDANRTAAVAAAKAAGLVPADHKPSPDMGL